MGTPPAGEHTEGQERLVQRSKDPAQENPARQRTGPKDCAGQCVVRQNAHPAVQLLREWNKVNCEFSGRTRSLRALRIAWLRPSAVTQRVSRSQPVRCGLPFPICQGAVTTTVRVGHVPAGPPPACHFTWSDTESLSHSL